MERQRATLVIRNKVAVIISSFLGRIALLNDNFSVSVVRIVVCVVLVDVVDVISVRVGARGGGVVLQTKGVQNVAEGYEMG